ncbi:hypothetical protein DFH05DRAFT_1521184 [Lentinula detonsa]|uniref:Uncharacterized protein n=1 Tax=Lentinula detonsa TaxID=2804962 RepID=A0A9W8P9N4_9AGAR|nr:hypothetical protein DFH05DRAFT_1521184 [Lentinula detonsa]
MDNQAGLGIRSVLSPSLITGVARRLRVICETFSKALLFAEEWRKFYEYDDWHDHSPKPWNLTKNSAAIVELVQQTANYFKTEKGAKSIKEIGAAFYGAIMSLYHISIIHFVVVESKDDIQFRLEHTPYL